MADAGAADGWGSVPQIPMADAIEYTLGGVEDDMREDGRERLDFRHLILDIAVLPQTAGSCRLRAGGADIIVGVCADLAETDPARPDEGRILVSVAYGPGGIGAGIPDYVAAGAAGSGSREHDDDKLLWLEQALASLYGGTSISAALRSLCIVPGGQCWELKVHAQLLKADGCPLDAISLAMRAALQVTRVPKVEVASADGAGASEASAGAEWKTGGRKDGGQGAAGGGGAGGGAKYDLELDESLDESVPFDASTVPLYMTLCTIGTHLVADCSFAERRAAGSSVSVGLNETGEVCAMVGGGGFGLHLATLADAVQTCRSLCAELYEDFAVGIAESISDAEARLANLPSADSVPCGLLGGF